MPSSYLFNIGSRYLDDYANNPSLRKAIAQLPASVRSATVVYDILLTLPQPLYITGRYFILLVFLIMSGHLSPLFHTETLVVPSGNPTGSSLNPAVLTAPRDTLRLAHTETRDSNATPKATKLPQVPDLGCIGSSYLHSFPTWAPRQGPTLRRFMGGPSMAAARGGAMACETCPSPVLVSSRSSLRIMRSSISREGSGAGGGREGGAQGGAGASEEEEDEEEE